ncbi:response regulator transcription factor [Paenibacillus tarimensis]|uniref:response regulator transcription factor n=1 Tax=Paenibacillus tarimensis TaxID=416012 RepID=UPI001F223038|nr:response regulator [Paenibacillus tarimensis]MCF2944689.1 response regulator [Paenibacillus tarimensis]
MTAHQILLVEDERWVRTALRKVIEKSGMPFKIAHEATNGMEASDWLSGNEVDLVVTDIRMPVMDGLELLKEIRSRRMRTDVIIVSGYDDFSYAQEALRQGAVDYFVKPVEVDDINRCFTSWLGRLPRAALRDDGKQPPVEDMSPVEQVLYRIANDPQSPMTMAEAAASVHLNPSYFCKLFKQKTGRTFTDYITETKVAEAVRLLEKTSLRVSEISARLGYTDAAYFTHTFKRITGLTPSDCRRQIEGVKGAARL